MSRDTELVRKVLDAKSLGPERGGILALMAVGIGVKRWKEIMRELSQ